VRKTATKRKNGKRILGLITNEGGGAFFGKECCENARVPGGREKEDWKDFSKSWTPGTFVKGNCFGTPLYTTCKSNEGGDKRPSLRKKGQSWYEGEGGKGAGQIQGVNG
jgi:hypothetical protein